MIDQRSGDFSHAVILLGVPGNLAKNFFFGSSLKVCFTAGDNVPTTKLLHR